jgi:hypothetical protein
MAERPQRQQFRRLCHGFLLCQFTVGDLPPEHVERFDKEKIRAYEPDGSKAALLPQEIGLIAVRLKNEEFDDDIAVDDYFMP